MSAPQPTLRDRRRAETQRAIQAHAIPLFAERGYDAVTLSEIAAASGISPMTLYRHFPTKEDLVLVGQQDQLIADRIAAGPADGALVQRIGRALIEAADLISGSRTDADDLLLDRLRLMITVPALRARHLDSQYATQQAIVDALRGDAAADPESDFRAWAAAGACLAAMNAALTRWATEDGRPDLSNLIAAALTAAFGPDVTGGS
ncbi:TetR family transcriptional regulator [Rhodococcus oryzae]|uniref:TetR family transcriptional regulator n=1 Tax=Rhodococcus oryzae TaxID=2571143 RepID=A0ABY2RGF9_9NOCA|nr:TetR/AcrR family transcriptional regulator [Rhodococcus oryzae]TJZ76018.1 TetR family transcriptional regulator [Rhodococcus oryzae]